MLAKLDDSEAQKEWEVSMLSKASGENEQQQWEATMIEKPDQIVDEIAAGKKEASAPNRALQISVDIPVERPALVNPLSPENVEASSERSKILSNPLSPVSSVAVAPIKPVQRKRGKGREIDDPLQSRERGEVEAEEKVKREAEVKAKQEAEAKAKKEAEKEAMKQAEREAEREAEEEEKLVAAEAANAEKEKEKETKKQKKMNPILYCCWRVLIFSWLQYLFVLGLMFARLRRSNRGLNKLVVAASRFAFFWDMFSDVWLCIELAEEEHWSYFYASLAAILLPYLVCVMGLGVFTYYKVTDWDNGASTLQRLYWVLEYAVLGLPKLLLRDARLLTVDVFNSFDSGTVSDQRNLYYLNLRTLTETLLESIPQCVIQLLMVFFVEGVDPILLGLSLAASLRTVVQEVQTLRAGARAQQKSMCAYGAHLLRMGASSIPFLEGIRDGSLQCARFHMHESNEPSLGDHDIKKVVAAAVHSVPSRIAVGGSLTLDFACNDFSVVGLGYICTPFEAKKVDIGDDNDGKDGEGKGEGGGGGGVAKEGGSSTDATENTAKENKGKRRRSFFSSGSGKKTKVKIAVEEEQEEGAQTEGVDERAATQTKGARQILLEGLGENDHQYSLMGAYEIVEGKQVNGRGVWQAVEGADQFIYFGGTNKWWVGQKEDVDEQKGAGWLMVASIAVTPDDITEPWKAWDDDDDTWGDASKVQAFACEEIAEVEEQQLEKKEVCGLGSCPQFIELVLDANPQAFEVERSAGKKKAKDKRKQLAAQVAAGTGTDVENAVAVGGPIGGGRLLGSLLRENKDMLSLSLAACALAGVAMVERSHQGRVRLDGPEDEEYEEESEEEYADEYGEDGEDSEDGEDGEDEGGDENMGGGTGRGGRYVTTSTRGNKVRRKKKNKPARKPKEVKGQNAKRRGSTMVWADAGVQVSVWRGTYVLGGVLALMEGLAHNHTLVHLNLEDNCIGAQGLVALCEAMQTASGKDADTNEDDEDDEDDEDGGKGEECASSPKKSRASSPPGRRLTSKAKRRRERELRKKRAGSGSCALRVLNLSNCRLLWGGVGHRRLAQSHSFKVKANLEKNSSFHKHWNKQDSNREMVAATKRIKRNGTSEAEDEAEDVAGRTEEELRRAAGVPIDYENEYDADLTGIRALAQLLIAHAEGDLALIDLSSNELTSTNVDDRRAVDLLFDALRCNQTLRVVDLRHNDVLDVVEHDELLGPGCAIRCCSHGKGVLLQTGHATHAADKLVEQLTRKSILAAHITLKKERGQALRDDMVQTRDAIRRTADEAANTFLDLIG
jgi:hypothetical protein